MDVLALAHAQQQQHP
ncbi:unnamed protein product, partial [Rotaria sp. Silwood1]